MRLIDSLGHYDSRILLSIPQSKYYQQLTKLARWLSKSGDGHVQVLLPIALYTTSDVLQAPFLIIVFSCLTVERGVYWVLKNVCKRQRPPEAIPTFHSVIKASDEFSFPSGHTSAAFLLVTILILLGQSWAVFLYSWAMLVGCSRIILGVHFPTDIIAGAIMGSCLAYLGHNYLSFLTP